MLLTCLVPASTTGGPSALLARRGQPAPRHADPRPPTRGKPYHRTHPRHEAHASCMSALAASIPPKARHCLTPSDAPSALPSQIIGAMGLLAQALQVMPIGRLDGGRATTSVFGRKAATFLSASLVLYQVGLSVRHRHRALYLPASASSACPPPSLPASPEPPTHPPTPCLSVCLSCRWCRACCWATRCSSSGAR